MNACWSTLVTNRPVFRIGLGTIHIALVGATVWYAHLDFCVAVVLLPQTLVHNALELWGVHLQLVAHLLGCVMVEKTRHYDGIRDCTHVGGRLIVINLHTVVIWVHPYLVDNHVGKFDEHQHHVTVHSASMEVAVPAQRLHR